jgi:hypothetical protein
MTAILLVAALLAQAPGPRPVIDDSYRWTRKPAMADFMRLYPPRALGLGQGAMVSMACKVRPDGTLEGCRIVDLNGADTAFGPATLALAGLFQLGTARGEPFPDGGDLSFPVRWPGPR